MINLLMFVKLGCVIIHKKAGIKLKKETYLQCFTHNKDGAGFCYVKDRKLVVDKGFFNFESFYEAIAKEEEREMIIHCRIATHGGISIDNCHPFEWTSKTRPNFHFSFAHNGVLPWPGTKTESDSACFLKEVLGPILDRDPWFLEHAASTFLLRSTIGLRNKLAIMRYDQEKDETKVYIVHEKEGQVAMGCWFSNWSYVIYTPPPYHGEYAGYGDREWVYEDVTDPITKVKSQVGRLRLKTKQKGQLMLEDKSDDKRWKPPFQDFSMPYFDKKQKKKIFKLANEWQKAFYQNLQGFSPNNSLYWLRDDVRDGIKGAAGWDVEVVDKWILTQIEANPSTLIPGELAAVMATEQPEVTI